MSTNDAPDWQHIVTLSTGPVSDSPDWQTTVVGPGGTPVGGGGPPDPWDVSNWGIAGWTMPPTVPRTASTTLVNGNLYLSPMPVTVAQSVDHMAIQVNTACSSLTANHNFIGIYQTITTGVSEGDFALIASTAAGVAENALKFTGLQTVALSTTVALSASHLYYAALLTNATSNTLKIECSAVDVFLGQFASNFNEGDFYYPDGPLTFNVSGIGTSFPNPLPAPSSLAFTGPMYMACYKYAGP